MRMCPRCKTSLRTIRYEGVEIETCDRCQGEWLDADELKPIVKERQEKWDRKDLEALKSASIQGVALKEVDEDLPCPVCREPMDPFNYGGDTGIVLDRCHKCGGIWLDAGEIEKVQMVVESWEQMVGADLKKYGATMRKVAAKVDAEDDVRVSRFGFVNAIMNRVLDVGW